MLWDAIHWIVSLLEVLAVVAAILFIGLMFAVVPLWIFSRMAGEGQPAADESDHNMNDDEQPILPVDPIRP